VTYIGMLPYKIGTSHMCRKCGGPVIAQEADDEVRRLREQLAEARDVRCPCGAPYVKVSGGYVPSCACSPRSSVSLAK